MVATERGAATRFARFIPPGATLYQAVGCPECSMTGYRGRFSIVEVLTMNPELERRIGDGATAEKIAEAARAAGMRSLWDSGLRHVLAGESTVEELLRVTDVRRTRKRRPHRGAAAPAGGARGLCSAAARRASARPVAAGPLEFSAWTCWKSRAHRRSAGGGPGQGACVLLVEDEDQLRRVMKDLLQREG